MRSGPPAPPAGRAPAPSCPVRVTRHSAGVLLDVKVIPRAKASGPDGVMEGALRLRLASPPVDGKANAECASLVAELFGLRKSEVEVLRGSTGRQKTLLLRGATLEHVESTLLRLLS